MPIDFHPNGSARSFGYHFLIGLQPSPRLTDHDKRLLDAVGPAGVVLFRDNFEQEAPYEQWLETLRRLLWEAREHIGRHQILVCIDHEGGRVHRPPAPITHLPAASRWAGRIGDLARAMGTELRSLGFNLNFAPVADVATRDGTDAIGDRAFAGGVAEVSEAVGTVIRELESVGVWACPKHFPGHGAATADSHLELPCLDTGLEELRRGHLLPFAAAVQAGARCMMSAHIRFPNIDPAQPSTLSAVLLGQVLREELGFRGLLITDDLGMRAVSDTFRHGAAVEEALAVTTDLLMVCAHWTDTNRVTSMVEGVRNGLRRGRLSESVLAESFERIRSALEAVPQHAVTPLAAEVLERHQAFETRPETEAGPSLVPASTAATADPTARRESS